MVRFLLLMAAFWALPMVVNAQDQVPGSIERCRIIAQEMVDYNDDSRLVFERFCEMLHAETPPLKPVAPSPPPVDTGSPDYFVKCVVANDPQWIGFRLVMRSQCDEMQGREMLPVHQPSNHQAKRDFGPKTNDER